MPKLNKKTRELITPFLKSLKDKGMTLREIESNLKGLKPLSRQGIKDILDKHDKENIINK